MSGCEVLEDSCAPIVTIGLIVMAKLEPPRPRPKPWPPPCGTPPCRPGTSTGTMTPKAIAVTPTRRPITDSGDGAPSSSAQLKRGRASRSKPSDRPPRGEPVAGVGEQQP